MLYFSLFLNLITDILSRSTPQMFGCCYHRQSCKNFAFICKIYYISKLLAELDLSNSKSKTYLKVTHSIEEIIQPNIRNSKNFDLNITELDKLLPIMYWLPKIQKTLVDARFIVATYYCSTNPLSDTVSKIFKMIFNTVESFHKKSFFSLGCKEFWAVPNSFQTATMLNKSNVKKNLFQILTVAPFI